MSRWITEKEEQTIRRLRLIRITAMLSLAVLIILQHYENSDLRDRIAETQAKLAAARLENQKRVCPSPPDNPRCRVDAGLLICNTLVPKQFFDPQGHLLELQ